MDTNELRKQELIEEEGVRLADQWTHNCHHCGGPLTITVIAMEPPANVIVGIEVQR